MGNLKAYEIYPLEERYRRQLPLSLMQLMKQKNVRVDDAAADIAFEVGLSADPTNPAILIGRGLYLMDTDRNPDEVDDIARTLFRVASRQQQVLGFLQVYEEWLLCGKRRCLPLVPLHS